MTFSDKLLLATIALSLAASALGRWASYLQSRAALQVSSHDSAMARLAGWAARVAAEIAATLSALPSGADVGMVKQALIATAVHEGRTEFAGSAQVVGATDDKIAVLVSRELDKVPVLRMGEAVLGMVAAAPALVPSPVPAAA